MTCLLGYSWGQQVCSTCSNSLFSFENIIHFTELTSFDLILLETSPHGFFATFTENEAEIIMKEFFQ